jgi:hypothetical protein
MEKQYKGPTKKLKVELPNDPAISYYTIVYIFKGNEISMH